MPDSIDQLHFRRIFQLGSTQINCDWLDRLGHLGFLKFYNFVGCCGPREARYITLPNFVKIRQSVAEILQFFYFSRWRPSAILNLFWAYLHHPRRVLGDLSQCEKFGCNRRNSFDNMKVWIFCAFGLKKLRPYLHPRNGFLGRDLTPYKGQQYQRTPLPQI